LWWLAGFERHAILPLAGGLYLLVVPHLPNYSFFEELTGVKTLAIQETQAPYKLAIDDESLGTEIIILERNGQPIAAVVPIAQFEAFQAWQQAVRRDRRRPELVAFDQERAVFERMLPELRHAYPGQVVAIYQGKIVEVGSDLAEVRERVYDRFGYVPCYVQVVEEPSRIYKFPHRKVIH
jgi:hypothetical protein